MKYLKAVSDQVDSNATYTEIIEIGSVDGVQVTFQSKTSGLNGLSTQCRLLRNAIVGERWEITYGNFNVFVFGEIVAAKKL